MGGCQNYGPLLGSLNTKCRIILKTQKRTIILTTTHILLGLSGTINMVGALETNKVKTVCH